MRSQPLYEQDAVTGAWVVVEKSFQWRNFIASRAVGLFPILWLALLIASPGWYDQDKSRIAEENGTKSDSAICAALYVIGMQSWWR